MSNDPQATRTAGTSMSNLRVAGSITNIATRVTGERSMMNIPAPPPVARTPWIFLSLVFVLSVGLAIVWTYLGRVELSRGVLDQSVQRLDAAQKAFDAVRIQTQAHLQSQVRVLVEDSRLKATLATEGMDVATVADILKDINALRRTGFLMVLTPDGHVFAEAGAPELRGLDLSTSGVVKKARTSPEAVVGSWVLGGKMMDLSIQAVRYGEALIAYLVVGQAVDNKLVGAVASHTDVGVATALADKVVLASPDGAPASVFAELARTGDSFRERVVTVDGAQYVGSAIELGDSAQSHRLLLAREIERDSSSLSTVRLMLFAPPILVAIAILFLISGIRRTP